MACQWRREMPPNASRRLLPISRLVGRKFSREGAPRDGSLHYTGDNIRIICAYDLCRDSLAVCFATSLPVVRLSARELAVCLTALVEN